MSAASYERQVARVSGELAALEAEAEQYAAHAEQQRRIRGNLDGELETYQRLAEVRAAISERIAGTVQDIGPLRAAITSVFTQVWLVADPHRPGYFGVLPEPRPETITILTPDAEGLQQAERQRVPVTFDVDKKCNATQGAAPDEDEQGIQRDSEPPVHGGRGYGVAVRVGGCRTRHPLAEARSDSRVLLRECGLAGGG